MTGTFGNFVKALRIARGLTLRAFCQQNGIDPGNWSKLERGLAPPPQHPDKLSAFALALALERGSEQWQEFFDRAAAANGIIPEDLLTDEEVVARLPVLFRTLRGSPVAPDNLDELINLIRRS